MKQVKAAEVARVEPVAPVSGADLAAALQPLPSAGPKGGAVPAGVPPPPNVDPSVLAELETKFEAANAAAASAVFTIRMPEPVAKYMAEQFVQGIKWKGLESYALTKATEDLQGIVNAATKVEGSNDVEFTIKHDLLEVVFHFIRNYEGVGYSNAKLLTQIAEVFVKPINELNELRSKTRDAAVEWEAAKHGMTPDQFVAQIEKSQQAKLN